MMNSVDFDNKNNFAKNYVKLHKHYSTIVNEISKMSFEKLREHLAIINIMCKDAENKKHIALCLSFFSVQTYVYNIEIREDELHKIILNYYISIINRQIEKKSENYYEPNELLDNIHNIIIYENTK